MKQFYVYIHRRPDGTPFYVGKGHGDRAKNLSSRNKHHKNIVSKYGPKNIKIDIIFCISEERALLAECRYINHFRSLGIELSNQSSGGEGGATGIKRTEEFRYSLHLLMTGRKLSNETKKKLSIARAGKTNPMLGRKHTPESIARMKRSHAGKPGTWNGKHHTPETKLILRNSQLGRKHTQEHNNRVREGISRVGHPRGMLGKRHSEETKQKIRLGVLSKKNDNK